MRMNILCRYHECCSEAMANSEEINGTIEYLTVEISCL